MPQLIPNANDWWKLWSIRFIALAGALALSLSAVQALPLSTQALFPDWFKQALAVGTAIATIAAGIARVLKQTLPGDPPADDNQSP